jgi:hypothetical protein
LGRSCLDKMKFEWVWFEFKFVWTDFASVWFNLNHQHSKLAHLSVAPSSPVFLPGRTPLRQLLRASAPLAWARFSRLKPHAERHCPTSSTALLSSFHAVGNSSAAESSPLSSMATSPSLAELLEPSPSSSNLPTVYPTEVRFEAGARHTARVRPPTGHHLPTAGSHPVAVPWSADAAPPLPVRNLPLLFSFTTSWHSAAGRQRTTHGHSPVEVA